MTTTTSGEHLMQYRTRALIAAATVVAVLTALFLAVAGWPSKADGGHAIVVRNGGVFDDNSVRQIIQPNSGLTFTGLWSHNHEYPSSQRNFVVSSAEGADSDEVINVPTKDGVNVGIEGTFYFTLNLDPAVLADFDNRFGTRTYDGKYAYEGDEGWDKFLSFTLGKLVQNVLRQEIGNVRCEAFVASCALVQNAAAVVKDGDSNNTITGVQNAVNAAFAQDVQTALGGPIFTGIQFTLSKVTLPQNVQDAINAAQSANVLSAQSQALQNAATIDAETNRIKQQGYANCPVCAQIDLQKSIPSSITVWAPGATATVPVK